MTHGREFYVGYLPAGVRTKLILRFLVPAIMFALLASAALFAMGTTPTGLGMWDTETTVAIEGVLTLEPYAEVTTPAGQSMLLVDAGKGGIRDGIEEFEGSRVRVEGFLISRLGMSVLELLPGEEGLRDLETLMVRKGERPTEAESPIEITGEVLDLKCYLGAMRPGEGVTHRGCAVLCVQGGIPPAIKDPLGNVHVLAGASWEAMNERAMPHVGVPSRVTGTAVLRGGVPYVLVETIESVED
ncbi:MAG: hypothetical protein RLN60_00635 [Phycisphaerales bacterium]